MTKSFLSLQTIVMAACLLSFAPAHAQESSKIAFVSTERIFREAAPAKAAQSKLERAGFAPDYVAIRRAEDLSEPADGEGEGLVALIAARLGTTRLIDNLQFD